MTDTINRFSDRARFYDRFRWNYAADAINTVFAVCGLNENSVVADIGSGSGMLARHFAGRVRTLFAVEPNPEMRAAAIRAAVQPYEIVDGLSDATTLSDNSVDLITVGRAIRWFPPESTRSEFRRIRKANGSLAIFQVRCTDDALMDSLKMVRSAENGWDVDGDKALMSAPPTDFYFEHTGFQQLSFPALVRETWGDLLGRITSLSLAPEANHPLRAKFEKASYRPALLPHHMTFTRRELNVEPLF